ncbi:unnamed protein product [Ectocarpus sp. 4 AP-2014]
MPRLPRSRAARRHTRHPPRPTSSRRSTGRDRHSRRKASGGGGRRKRGQGLDQPRLAVLRPPHGGACIPRSSPRRRRPPRRPRLGEAAQGAVGPHVPTDPGQRHGGVGGGLEDGFAGRGRRFSGGRRAASTTFTETGRGGRGAEGVGQDDGFRGVLEGVLGG